MAPSPSIEEDPVRRYLREQRELRTPVVRFAEDHATGARTQARFRELLPLSAPAAGEQYAFEVDLDSCTGCKSCVAACHSQNGLDEGEWWREVQGVCGGTPEHPFAQAVTAACHHCENPGCLEGCPVLAYEKDSVTGIVRHLDDQCIGCQYCVWTCPYEAPKYNERLGIVRKCDMCQQRLSHGEAPACAQACPTDAIRIVTVSRTGATDAFFPAEPDPVHTAPTTRYVTKRTLPPNLRPAAAEAPAAQPAHPPLVAMLVLMQVSVGVAAASHPVTALALQLVALGIGTAHLGQPMRAWRVFLNLRKSWFSREVLAFTVYLAALGAAAAAHGLVPAAGTALSGVAAGLGLAAIITSIALYAVTARPSWSAPRTAARFLGTGVLAWLTLLWLDHRLAAWPVAGVLGAKLLAEADAFAFGARGRHTSLARTTRILRGPLRAPLAARYALGTAALLFVGLGIPSLAALTILAGELIERDLFFRAVAAPEARPAPAS